MSGEFSAPTTVQRTRNFPDGIKPYIFESRRPAVDASGAAVAILATDDRIILRSTTGTKTIGTTSAYEGQRLTLFVESASGGAYTIALSGGASFDLGTLDAAGETLHLERCNDAWIVIGSGGGASFS